MGNETAREVWRNLREAQTKYVYFLLAASGGAIALAVTKTQDAGLAWSQIPLAAAVTSWGLSFFFGCRHLSYASSTLFANAELIKVESGQHPAVGTHPQKIVAAGDGIRAAIETNSNRANRLGHRQFHLLITGAAFFIAWHVLEMYLRTG